MPPLSVAGSLLSALLVSAPADEAIVALLAEVDRLGASPLWPGFAPSTMPVMLYDGERTWLARHPQPPAPFERLDEELAVVDERHPLADANTSVDLAGVRTASVLLPQDDAEPVQTAALVLHELFHAWQPPAWSADETALFTYPEEDRETLALRLLEDEALRGALLAPDRGDAALWAASALALRGERYARMPAESAAYERGLELTEGLASYVQHQALLAGGVDLRRVPGPTLPRLARAGFGPGEVRSRGYATGLALALLLDRFEPGWSERLDGTLDGRLAEVLASEEVETPLTPAGALAAARADADGRVASFLERRRAGRDELLARPGLLLVVEGQLWPAGFDPLNVSRVGDLEILHSRWLELSDGRGGELVLERPALTEGTGPHPLFQGVARVWVPGLTGDDVTLEVRDGSLHLEAPGLRLELPQGYVVEHSATRLHVRVGPAPEAG